MNWQRKDTQQRAGQTLARLEIEWATLVHKNYEIEEARSNLLFQSVHRNAMLLDHVIEQFAKVVVAQVAAVHLQVTAVASSEKMQAELNAYISETKSWLGTVHNKGIEADTKLRGELDNLVGKIDQRLAELQAKDLLLQGAMQELSTVASESREATSYPIEETGQVETRPRSAALPGLDAGPVSEQIRDITQQLSWNCNWLDILAE